MVSRKMRSSLYKRATQLGRYQTRTARGVNRYVTQFYEHTRMLFQKKLYYRKVVKKAKRRWVAPSGAYAPLWTMEAGVHLFQSFGGRGLVRGGERLWMQGIFQGVKRWLLLQQRCVRFVLHTHGRRARFWGQQLLRLRATHRTTIQVASRTTGVPPKNKDRERWVRWEARSRSMVWRGRGRRNTRVSLAGVLWGNLIRLVHYSIKHPAHKGGSLAVGGQRLLNKRRRFSLRGVVFRRVSLLAQKVSPASTLGVRPNRAQFQRGLGMVSGSRSNPSSLRAARSWLSPSPFSLRILKEVVWRRHRKVRTVWVVEKGYHDLDVQAIVQQELMDPAGTGFAAKESMEKSSVRRRLSKQQKEEERKKKRKRFVQGYLLGMPSIRQTKNISLFRRCWLTRAQKGIGLAEGELDQYGTNQICRLLTARPTVFADNVMRHQHDVQQKKKVRHRLRRQSDRRSQTEPARS